MAVYAETAGAGRDAEAERGPLQRRACACASPQAIAGFLGAACGVALLLGGGYLFREPIKRFLEFFINAVDDWGPWGYVAYAVVYTALEVRRVPP